MTEYELLRIISFLERMRKPYDQLLPVAEPDQNWNMVIFLMRSYLRGQTVSMSSLAQSAEVPFASAMRRVHRLIELGEVEKQEKTPGSRTFYLVPSARLIENFHRHLIRCRHVQETAGVAGGQKADREHQASREGAGAPHSSRYACH